MNLPLVRSEDPRGLFARVSFMNLLGMRRDAADVGRARVSIDARPEIGSVIGGVHGGVVVALLDVVMASAAVSLVDFSLTVVTLNLNTSFIEPGHGSLVAEGEVVERNGALVCCRSEVRDTEGRLVARAQGSFRYLPRTA